MTKVNILIVDDEPDICWALEKTLENEDYQITLTTSGQKALELVKEKPFQVAFIDAKLPDIDGVELSARVKHADSRIAIIMISGYFYEEDRAIQEGLQRGAYAGFIAKPFDLREVREMTRRAVRSPEASG